MERPSQRKTLEPEEKLESEEVEIEEEEEAEIEEEECDSLIVRMRMLPPVVIQRRNQSRLSQL